jgi:hypothetical protein
LTAHPGLLAFELCGVVAGVWRLLPGWSGDGLCLHNRQQSRMHENTGWQEEHPSQCAMTTQHTSHIRCGRLQHKQPR